jgi:hypothetical protein
MKELMEAMYVGEEEGEAEYINSALSTITSCISSV